LGFGPPPFSFFPLFFLLSSFVFLLKPTRTGKPQFKLQYLAACVVLVSSFGLPLSSCFFFFFASASLGKRKKEEEEGRGKPTPTPGTKKTGPWRVSA
jgi:hypothetical protein